MRNYVYWNIYDRLFTIQNWMTGRVRRHTEKVTLKDADFEIDESERARMLETGRKTLHAGIRGEIVDFEPKDLQEWVPVIYRPLDHEGFVRLDDEGIVTRADMVHMVVQEGRAHIYAIGLKD